MAFSSSKEFVLLLGAGGGVDHPRQVLDLLALHVELLHRDFPLAALAAHFVVAGVDRYPGQPAAQGTAAEAVELAEGGDQGLLDCIGGNILVVKHAQGDAEQQVLVAKDQSIECVQIPALRGFD